MSSRLGRCGKCQQQVCWYVTRERGTPVALDPSPDPDEGTVIVSTSEEQTHRGRTRTVVYVDILSGDALITAQANDDPLFMLHSKTCPAHKPFNPRPAHVRLDLPTKPRPNRTPRTEHHR